MQIHMYILQKPNRCLQQYKIAFLLTNAWYVNVSCGDIITIILRALCWQLEHKKPVFLSWLRRAAFFPYPLLLIANPIKIATLNHWDKYNGPFRTSSCMYGRRECYHKICRP